MGASGTKEPITTDFSSNLDKNNDQYRQGLSSHPNSALKMPMANTFRCHRCGMIFPTDETLYQHRIRFCTGQMEGPRDRHVNYSDGDPYNNQSRMNLPVIHQPSPAERV